MTNTSVGQIMPARFIDVDKALKVHQQIAGICSVLLTASLVGLVSCQTKLKNSVPMIDTRITCVNIQPITYVKSDSPKTKAQIITHNEVWEYYCDRRDE